MTRKQQVKEPSLEFEIKLNKLTKVDDVFKDGSVLKTILERNGGNNIPNGNAVCWINYTIKGMIDSEAQLLSQGEFNFELDDEQLPTAWTFAIRTMMASEVV